MMAIQWENLGRGILGMFFLIGLCYALSNNRKAINWRLVTMGIVAQIAFAIGVLSQERPQSLTLAPTSRIDHN